MIDLPDELRMQDDIGAAFNTMYGLLYMQTRYIRGIHGNSSPEYIVALKRFWDGANAIRSLIKICGDSEEIAAVKDEHLKRISDLVEKELGFKPPTDNSSWDNLIATQKYQLKLW